ncbi:sigma-70 family RNA polymerase sigma factor [Roseomonas sp. GC11]|uniref:sigma-70 family RNA polymerase sigma factor n=1 Tax=Roseomonas sp. GC11 TaxID=2950546 RepID=UPI00210A13C3|nr:sigma-70 family RNA polymerase sigma factor [Roseomonas sp. GC11]MCQ4159102.1 sigma-70 family RNA polymerase sigma factor [Roseomonas sp. GC11]
MPDHSPLELYLRHQPRLLDYAAALTGDRSSAEDVLQDAYFRLPAEASTAEIRRPLAYLFRIVRNLVWDRGRRHLADQRHREQPEDWLHPAPPPTPEEEAALRQSLRHLAAHLAELPEQSRIALEMHRFGGYRLEEIAARLGVSVPTAHRLVKDALLRLAAALPDAAP